MPDDAVSENHALTVERINQKRKTFERLANQFHLCLARCSNPIRLRYVFHETDDHPASQCLDLKDNDDVWQTFETFPEAMPHAWGYLVFQLERCLGKNSGDSIFESWKRLANTAGFELYKHLALAGEKVQLGPNFSLWISSMTIASQAGLISLPNETPHYVDRDLEIKIAEQSHLSPSELKQRKIRKVSVQRRNEWEKKLRLIGIETVFHDVIAASELWANYLATNDRPYVTPAQTHLATNDRPHASSAKTHSRDVESAQVGRPTVADPTKRSALIERQIAKLRSATTSNERSTAKTNLSDQKYKWPNEFAQALAAMKPSLLRDQLDKIAPKQRRK